MTVVLLKALDNAESTLNSGISPSTLSIPLVSGGGAAFPQPYTGTTSSLGTSTTLNKTSIGSSGIAVNDVIRNYTDGSWAFVTAVSTNSLTTTQLKGGSNNIWGNGDTYRVNEFVITLAKIDANGNDTASEDVLISNRSTDTLVVPTGGRGYNSTVAQSFDATDHVQLRVSAPYHEQLKSLLKELNQTVDTNTTAVAAIRSGSDFYAVATGSANAFAATYANLTGPIEAGMEFFFLANFTISGSTTLTITLGASAQSAKTIKKVDGATNLASGDIVSGQLVHVRYDGTNLQMLSPVGQTPATPTFQIKYQNTADSNDISTDTSAADWNTNYTVDASDVNSKLAVGVGYVVEAWGVINGGTSTRNPNIALNFGSVVLGSFNYVNAPNAALPFHLRIEVVCRSVGATGTVQVTGMLDIGLAAAATPLVSTGVAHHIVCPSPVTVDTTSNAALKLTNYWNVNDGTGKSSILKNVTIARFATS